MNEEDAAKADSVKSGGTLISRSHSIPNFSILMNEEPKTTEDAEIREFELRTQKLINEKISNIMHINNDIMMSILQHDSPEGYSIMANELRKVSSINAALEQENLMLK